MDLSAVFTTLFSLMHFSEEGVSKLWFGNWYAYIFDKISRKEGQLYDFEEIEIGGNALSSYDIKISLMFQTMTV